MKREAVRIGGEYYTKIVSGQPRIRVKVLGYASYPIGKPDFLVQRANGAGQRLTRSAAQLHLTERG